MLLVQRAWADGPLWCKLVFSPFLILIPCFALQGCADQRDSATPAIVFTKIPPAAEGGTQKLNTIAGRVIGAHPGQRVVVYARSGQWWVQPFADHPFTSIQANSKWSTSTHLGYEYAALLVEPAFQPPPRIDVLPAQADSVLSVAIVEGLPPFWQTWWFEASSIVLVLLLLWCAHVYHVRQLAKQFNIRLDERVSERTRIARDLHDTLLQSFHGVLLRFQAISNDLAEGQTKQKLGQAIDQAAQAVAEGRNAIQGLRHALATRDDLATALSTLGEQLAADKTIENPPAFEVAVEGTPRELDPLLRDEVYRIGLEALRNAFRHANARRIALEVQYAENQLRVRIRDDGKGMDAAPRNGDQRLGHWGLPGMHERAKLVGGHLEVWSKRNFGTQIELTIPASAAYASSGDRRRSWFSWRETDKANDTND